MFQNFMYIKVTIQKIALCTIYSYTYSYIYSYVTIYYMFKLIYACFNSIVFLKQVKLLGHSLGGAISFLYAASYPDEVDVVISLDIVSPSVKDVKKTAAVTGEYIDKFLKYELLTLDNVPCYEYNEMLEIVEKAHDGSITREGAKILMKRGMQPAYKKGEYYFSRDPRLKVKTFN